MSIDYDHRRIRFVDHVVASEQRLLSQGQRQLTNV